MLELNPDFARQFYGQPTGARATPFRFPKAKDPDVTRVLVLGESAAAGTPDPAFSFSRILDVMLQQQFPERHVEVVNVAMRGIDSSIVRLIALECSRVDPDVLMVLMGNNDFIGLHAPEPGSSRWSQSRVLQRFVQACRSTYLGQFLVRKLSQRNRREVQDMAYLRSKRLPHDHWSRAAVARNFSANLDDVIAAADRAGAAVIVSTVPVNLRDFPPVGSLRREGIEATLQTRWDQALQAGIEDLARGRKAAAVERFRAALEIDDAPADLHFRMAEVLAALGDQENAKHHFLLARDRDALPLRTDRRLNEAVRRVAADARGRRVGLVDAEQLFFAHARTDAGVPGDALFLDHVHPTFEGNYLLARAFEQALLELTEVLPVAGSLPSQLPTLEECRQALAFTPWEELKSQSAQLAMMKGPPFVDQIDHGRRQQSREQAYLQNLASFRGPKVAACRDTYRVAMAARPDDWMLRYNVSYFLLEQGPAEDAVQQARFVVERYPNYAAFRLRLAEALAAAGRREESLLERREAQRLQRGELQAHSGSG